MIKKEQDHGKKEQEPSDHAAPVSGSTATKYIITADHGFLYRRDKLQASDKIPIPKDVCAYENKRFLITREKVSGQGFLSRALAYFCKINEAYVTTPIGADIFSASGAGQNYVHGGSSLQEMIIPVVEVRPKLVASHDLDCPWRSAEEECARPVH